MYAVIFRRGGTENFRWSRLNDFRTYDDATREAESLERMGYPALVHDAKHLDAVGLPETFAAGEPLPVSGPRVKVGDFIKPDGWRIGGSLIASDWDAAPFRVITCTLAGGPYMPTPSGYVELAVRVEITGRGTRKMPGGGWGWRCRVVFVGDGEPDQIVGGWYVENAS
jgi:hypothetical protein